MRCGARLRWFAARTTDKFRVIAHGGVLITCSAAGVVDILQIFCLLLQLNLFYSLSSNGFKNSTNAKSDISAALCPRS